jgi:glycosyltransferase involved in cell wall biosynthesis
VNILHIIPRFIGGGPERHLLAVAAAWKSAGLQTSHRVLVLESPVSARLLLRARALGIAVTASPTVDQVHHAIASADAVEIYFWNHPAMQDMLRHELPAMRLLVSAVITGTTIPQVLAAGLGSLADALVMRSPASRGTACAAAAGSRGIPVEVVPALADMTRLEGFQPRAHEGVRVGYVGLVEPTKMHPNFAELSAAVHTPGVTFDVFGDGTWGAELERQMSALGAPGRMRVHGHTEDLCGAFAEMDIFGYPLAPGTYASSDKTIQEAMWAGIPPVVIAGTGAAALVDHERTGLVCASESEYAHAIERLVRDADLRRRLGDAARAHARETFDPTRNAARLRAMFESLATTPKRSHAPLDGAGLPGAGKFVASLGELAGPFAVSLEGVAMHPRDAVRDADGVIASCSDVVARGEGGVVHYRNTYPGDPHLHLWSGLITRFRSGPDSGDGDLRAALDGGIEPWRVAVHHSQKLPSPRLRR